MSISNREKLLLGVLALVLIVGSVWLVWQRVADYRFAVQSDVAIQERLLRQVNVAAQQMQDLTVRPASPLGRISLIGHIEQLAARLALKENLQLNQLAQTGSPNVEGVEVRLDNLSIDDLLAFLHAIEQAEPVMVIDRMEVTPNFRSKDLLRLTARVLAEK